MFLTYLTLISALSLSAVAAFYSIAGLSVIFAAAVVPVIIMGSILEVAKLVVTVWLHEYWQRVRLLMKVYLVTAVVVLMFITSMGIFGFLSKAHIEQTAAGVESVAQIERVSAQINRQQDIVARADQLLNQLRTSGIGSDTNVQSQIDREKDRIDSAYRRVQPAIDEQQRIIDQQLDFYQSQLTRIDQDLATLQGHINTGDIRKAQAMVGAATDGQFGPRTAAAFRSWQSEKNQERQGIVDQIAQLESNPVVQTARSEINRIRSRVESEITESNQLINRLQEQLGQSSVQDVEAAIQKQQQVITTANAEIDRLTDEKFKLQSSVRKLEAEVGPVKYIAEFVYGTDADKNMLEEAVRWVIVIIVVVFDPLAVMMLLAATESLKWHRANTNSVIRRRRGVRVNNISEPVISSFESRSVAAEHNNHNQAETHDTAHQSTSEKVAENEVDLVLQELDDDAEENNDYDEIVKQAKHQWKINNPNKTLKEQRRLFKAGAIDQLPWIQYISTPTAEIAFGPIWPDNPQKGYMFLRTDYVPTKLFKFNGNKWIEVSKDISDSYTTNSAYLDFLMSKIESGEYDPDLLSTSELEEIEQRLKKGDQ